jgi:hypothetical protein
MMTTATRNEHDNTSAAVLFMACELSEKTWKLGFSVGHGYNPRERMLPARDQKRVQHMEITEVVIVPRSPWQNPYTSYYISLVRLVTNGSQPSAVASFASHIWSGGSEG